MTAILAAAMLLPWSDPTPGPYLDGKATYYNVRLMEEVAANRGMALGNHAGFVAMNRAGDLGRSVWIEHDGQMSGPFLVVDVAQDGAHYQAREERGHVVEVSWEQAQEWGMRGPVKVRVHFMAPEPEGAI